MVTKRLEHHHIDDSYHFLQLFLRKIGIRDTVSTQMKLSTFRLQSLGPIHLIAFLGIWPHRKFNVALKIGETPKSSFPTTIFQGL